MTDQNSVLIREFEGVVGYIVARTSTVTTNDTVKIKELSTIKKAVAFKIADWSTVTLTYSGNIITVTQAGLSADAIAIMAGGIK